MLVPLYIISAVAGVFASVFEKFENFKYRVISTIIAILSGIAFCVPMIRNFTSDISNPDFWCIFAVLSLIAWQLAFLLNDEVNLFDYEVAIFILSLVICFYCSAFTFSDYLISCNVEHVATDVVLIVKVDKHVNQSTYTAYFKTENGETKSIEIPKSTITINLIEDDEAPYLEIVTITDCMGYTRETLRHAFTTVTKTYNLYIQEDSINPVQTNIISSK